MKRDSDSDGSSSRTPPRLKRQRTQSLSRHPAQLIHLPGDDPVTHFLKRHVNLKDVQVQAHEFNLSRLVHYDHEKERGLFSRFDLNTGRWRWEWARTHIAKGRKVKIETRHEPDCNGWAKEKGQYLMGKVLATCGCSTQWAHREYVWMVSPRQLAVEHNGETIRHMARCRDQSSWTDVPKKLVPLFDSSTQ